MHRHEISTQVWCRVKAENLFSKIFIPPLKKFRSEKPQIYLKLEAHSFEMAQHIDKQITDFIDNKCATKQCQSWAITPQSFDAI